MRKRCSWFLGLAVITILACGSAASADSLAITLTESSQTVTQGTSVVAFDATVSNPLSNSDTLFLDSAGGSTSDASVLIDLTAFYLNAPLSLDPGQSSGPFELFDVDLQSSASGMYSGIFSIYDGSGVDIGDADFSVNVLSPTTTPEPSTLVLYLFGLALVGIVLVSQKWRRPTTT